MITQLCGLYYKDCWIDLKHNIFKIRFGSLQNKFYWEFFNGSHGLTLFACMSSDKIDGLNPSFLLLLCHWLNIASKLSNLSFFKSKIFLWQVIGYLKEFVHRLIFECIHIAEKKWQELRDSTLLGQCHYCCWMHFAQTWTWNKMTFLLHYFQNFVRTHKIKDLTESKNVFAGVVQITISTKYWGARCTLK